MSVNFIHFDLVLDIGLPGVAEVLYHNADIRNRPDFAHFLWRFRDEFLPALNDKDYYVFITTVAQEGIFQTHVKEYGLAPFMIYQSPFTFPNARYNLSPKLNLRIYKFTPEFIAKLKETKK